MIVALPTKDYAGGSHCEKVSICHVYGVTVANLPCPLSDDPYHVGGQDPLCESRRQVPRLQ